MSRKLNRSTSPEFKRPPGPAGLPLLGHLLQARRDPLRFALNLTRKYGDISYFRIGIYQGYLLNHPDFFQQVLKTNHRNYSKENYNYKKLKPVLGEGLITATGDFWLQNRRLIQPVFHRKNINHFSSTVVNATREMLEGWEEAARHGHPVRVAADMMKLTLSIITRSLFSTDLRSSASIIDKAFTTLNRDIARRFKNPFVPPRWIPTPRNQAFKKARRQLDRLVYEIIERRKRISDAPQDLLGMLLEARDEHSGEGMNDRQLRDEVMTLMLAGHETTANLLSWTCYLLSRHPEKARKLHGELKEIPGERIPEVDDLPYTESVLRESLRLYPPVWIISRKAVGHDVIGGYPIPAGTTVALCSYTLHRHPDFWDHPGAFRPERFSSGGQGEPSHPAYFPFGGGPRSCIGSHFAMMEARLILAIIFRRYRLRPAPGHPVDPEPLITLRPRHGLKMTLEPECS